MVAAEGASKRFVKRLDLAGKLARSLGARLGERVVHAVDRVDLAVAKGEVMGLVGESGCGKTTLGRMIVGILPPSEGRILFKGRDRASLDGRERRAARLAMQMIFQDPFASLNPRMPAETIVGEAVLAHGLVARGELPAYVDDLLSRVGLDPALKRLYPHQFSGGQRQRIGIARALAVKPEFLVCDEAIAALDVSIQAQIINLFMDLREAFDLTYLFISHGLAAVRHLADRVAVMYLGRIVESAPAAELFRRPNHPYTQALLAEMPRLEARKRAYAPIAGEIPSPYDPPRGCHFHPRCPHAFARCRDEAPRLKPVAPGHLSACHLNDG
jgi:peptide/nickel transport system ATP-binding protein